MALFEWIALSYYVRGEFYKLREQPYVLAARALGESNVRILFRQILPNAMTPVITLLPFMIVAGISALTALDFLGFGLQPPTPSWGEMIQDGLQNIQAPWLATSAVGALFFTLLLASFVGEGLREAFDPRSHTKLQ
jgi:microcin C transport system permease protein